MLVLFSIAMVCFFALFGMMIILLRQAKAEGSRTKLRGRSLLSSDLTSTATPSRVSQAAMELNLSNLVPMKRPDWRFMVREGGARQRPPSRTVFPSAGDRADLVFAHKDLGDLTDPPSNYTARRA